MCCWLVLGEGSIFVMKSGGITVYSICFCGRAWGIIHRGYQNGIDWRVSVLYEHDKVVVLYGGLDMPQRGYL